MDWVKTKDRVPDLGRRVLAYRDGEITIETRKTVGGIIYWYEYPDEVPSHWMPLPAAPELSEYEEHEKALTELQELKNTAALSATAQRFLEAAIERVTYAMDGLEQEAAKDA